MENSKQEIDSRKNVLHSKISTKTQERTEGTNKTRECAICCGFVELAGADGSFSATLYLQMREQRARWVTYRVATPSTGANWLSSLWCGLCPLKVPQVWLKSTKKKDTSLHILDTDT